MLSNEYKLQLTPIQTDSWPICPDCSSQVTPGALKNVESILSLHQGKKACQDAAKKRNKTGKQRTIADMFSGVQKAKPKLPLVQSPKPVQSKAAHQALATPTTTSISTSMITSTAFPMIQHSQLLIETTHWQAHAKPSANIVPLPRISSIMDSCTTHPVPCSHLDSIPFYAILIGSAVTGHGSLHGT